jgi:transposase
MGASNFTYAEASWTQALADWIGAHTRAFAALGGVPKLLVPDNTKVAVIKACLYEPQVNRTYAEMAAHYDTAILPARPRRPRDKAKVEVAVLIIERWLLGRLRHRRFYSLAELNAAIGELLRQLNDERPIRRLGVTRRALFEQLDRPNLNSLPPQPYCFAEWRVRRVGIDYHVELEGHFYSVPHRFARSEVEVRLRGHCKTFIQKADHFAVSLLTIVRLFYPEMKARGWEDFHQLVKSRYGDSDNSYKVSEMTTPLLLSFATPVIALSMAI